MLRPTTEWISVPYHFNYLRRWTPVWCSRPLLFNHRGTTNRYRFSVEEILHLWPADGSVTFREFNGAATQGTRNPAEESCFSAGDQHRRATQAGQRTDSPTSIQLTNKPICSFRH